MVDHLIDRRINDFATRTREIYQRTWSRGHPHAFNVNLHLTEISTPALQPCCASFREFLRGVAKLNCGLNQLLH